MKHEEHIRKQLGKQKFRLLYSDNELEMRVKELADQIAQDFQNSKPLVIIGVLKGSFIFIADLVRHLTIPLHVEFITASSYSKTQSTGIVTIRNAIPDLKSKDVLIIEDIIDSGLTIKTLIEEVQKQKPSQVKVCSLFVKPDKIKESISKIDYVGFSISDAFIVGYGLDYDQNFRELPHVVELLDVNL